MEMADLQEAVERIIGGLEKRNRVLNKREKERVVHHEVGHALVALNLPGSDPVQKISIIPRGIAALGYTLQLPTEDRFLMTKSELENKIAMLLGGRGDALNMTYLALNLSDYVNGVAKKHGEVSRLMFGGYTIDAITNGVLRSVH